MGDAIDFNIEGIKTGEKVQFRSFDGGIKFKVNNAVSSKVKKEADELNSMLDDDYDDDDWDWDEDTKEEPKPKNDDMYWQYLIDIVKCELERRKSNL